MLSFWEKHYWYTQLDIVIVGSGIVGVSTAIALRKKYPEKSIAIVERGQIPTGASTKNAGFACFGTVGEILDDLKNQTEEEVMETIKLRWQGLNLLQKKIKPQIMDLQINGGSEVFLEKEQFEQCETQIKYINRLVQESTGVKNCFGSKKNQIGNGFHKNLIFNSNEGQLNPVLMMKNRISSAMNAGIQLISGFELTQYQEESYGFSLHATDHRVLKTEKVVFCTNAFTNSLIKGLDIVPARNQVLVSQVIENMPIKGCFHLDKGYVYFRNIGNRLLIGGARNIDSITETTVEFGENPSIIQHLKRIAEEKILQRQIKIETQWSGIIATGHSKKPIVQRIENNLYIAVRLGGMGIAIGSVIAEELVKVFE